MPVEVKLILGLKTESSLQKPEITREKTENIGVTT